MQRGDAESAEEDGEEGLRKDREERKDREGRNGIGLVLFVFNFVIFASLGAWLELFLSGLRAALWARG
jgi:hypothetical protein